MIFVDTSAWLALADPLDGQHAAAMNVAKMVTTGKFGRMVTTDYVLDETYTLIRKSLGIEEVERLAGSLKATPNLHVRWVGERLFEAALARMLKHRDKAWSLTDCTSFETMEELGVRVGFTFDRDFQVAGFETLPEATARKGRA